MNQGTQNAELRQDQWELIADMLAYFDKQLSPGPEGDIQRFARAYTRKRVAETKRDLLSQIILADA